MVSRMKTLTRLVVSAACSVLVLGLLLSLAGSLGADVAPGDVVAALRSAVAALVAAYALCQLVQAFARAQRARVLLRASLPAGTRVPGLFRMLLVTFVRGACADMLPARIGELSYVAMLNRGCAVPAADCLSSLSIGLLFDFLALLAVLAVSIPAAAQGLTLVGSMLMLAAICAAGVALLFFALPVAAGWRWERFAPFRWRPIAWLLKLARDVAAAVVAVRRGRVAGRVLALSLAVRAAKYAGLYALFVAVTRPLWPALSHAPVSAVLVALIAAEGAASLPVPTFMSFGSYEAGGLAALTALCFPAGDSLVAMMAMHLLSQAIDYSLGGLAFLVFSWCAHPARKGDDGDSGDLGDKGANPANGVNGVNGVNDANRAGRARLARLLLALLFLGASLLFAAWQARAIKKRGRLTAPPKGEAVQPTAAETAARDAMMRAFGGKIVWSSNRSGSHDLLSALLARRHESRFLALDRALGLAAQLRQVGLLGPRSCHGRGDAHRDQRLPGVLVQHERACIRSRRRFSTRVRRHQGRRRESPSPIRRPAPGRRRPRDASRRLAGRSFARILLHYASGQKQSHGALRAVSGPLDRASHR